MFFLNTIVRPDRRSKETRIICDETNICMHVREYVLFYVIYMCVRYVSEHSGYHHGEASLFATMVTLI